MNAERVGAATAKAARFLQSVQLASGGFESFSSPTRSPFRPHLTYRTTFAPALMLSALSQVQDPAVLSIRQKLADWLLGQKSPNWSFNYWAADASERATLPYPDDLDDTFCALIALREHDASLVNEACLGKIVKLLIATETQVGGPYRTWLAAQNAPKVWQDVDLAVNCNVAAFLGLVAEPLPNLTALMEQAITTKAYYSPYYASAYPLAYYLARAYRGPQTSVLANYLARRQREGWWGSPLRSALAICALTRLGQGDRCLVAVRRLLERQLPDGSWEAEAFCLDPAIKNQRHYNGSAALTTALVLEALARYNQAKTAPTSPSRDHDKTAHELYKRITTSALRELDELDPHLRHHGRIALERMKSGDKNHEIVLLPYFFNRSLVAPVTVAHSDRFIQLGLANLYGWTAYTIYDDFLDEEGVPAQLPVANTALRYSLGHFAKAAPHDAGFQRLVRDTFNTIDGANAWEATTCRFILSGKTLIINRLPRYGNRQRLAERSLGHTLTPLGVLAAAGVQPKDRRAQAIQRALQHYLIARQLSDDMHDWEQDLCTGQATYVVTAILQELSLPPGKYRLAQLLPKMRRQFWQHTITQVCQVTTRHTALARRAAKASHLLTHPNIITHLTNRIDASVQHTLTEQSKAQNFLAAYRKV